MFGDISKNIKNIFEELDEAGMVRPDLVDGFSAKDKFNFILENYPNTDFAMDSKFKLDLIEDILAAKEMYIGRYYLKKEKYLHNFYS